jgi:hypothetical protein
MTIEALMKLVPPPAEPTDSETGPWEPLEEKLGATFPQDYKDFVRVYGSGRMFDFFNIYVPRAENPYRRLGTQLINLRRDFFNQMEGSPPVWPDPGGLIACGGTDLCDYIFWLPEGPPEDWKIVAWWRKIMFPWRYDGDEPFHVFDCGLTDFLSNIATGEIVLDQFAAAKVEPNKHRFVPTSAHPDRTRWEWNPTALPEKS